MCILVAPAVGMCRVTRHGKNHSGSRAYCTLFVTKVHPMSKSFDIMSKLFDLTSKLLTLMLKSFDLTSKVSTLCPKLNSDLTSEVSTLRFDLTLKISTLRRLMTEFVMKGVATPYRVFSLDLIPILIAVWG